MGFGERKFTENAYTGNYKVCWGGMCLVLDSDEVDAVNLAPLSFCLTFIPCCVWTWVIPFDNSNNTISSVIMCVLVWSFVMNATHKLFKCYTTEPGILPFREIDTPLEEGISETYAKRVLVIDGEELDLSSKRAKVCRQTNTAIERFDHYCPWTGNAIGRRNYPFFFGFICSTTLLSLIVFATSVICIINQSNANGDFTRYMASNTYVVTMQLLVSIYSLILFLTLIGLTTYHVFLVCRNVTTNEDLKGVYAHNKVNKYDQGVFTNISNILFSKIPPSRVKDGGSNITKPLMK
eukprot:g6501.t1